MINKDRIVPVTKTDLLSLYSAILSAAGEVLEKASSTDIEGVFDVQDQGSVSMIADQPIVKVEISGADAVVLYFVADPKYTGFEINGVPVETTGDEVIANGTLYKASITAGSPVEISTIGF